MLAMVFRTPSSLSPGSMPAATAEAATVAASPRPKAVPFTEAVAFFMIDSTEAASLPRPRSFALAVSIAVRREKPPVRAVPMPAAAAPTATVAGPESVDAMVEPIREAPEAAAETIDDSPEDSAEDIERTPEAIEEPIEAIPGPRAPTSLDPTVPAAETIGER